MKALDHHLYLRGGSHFYYRCAFPRNLHPFLRLKELRVSLNTKDLNTARLYVAKLDIGLEPLIQQVYDRLKTAQSYEDARKVDLKFVSSLNEMQEHVGLKQNDVFGNKSLQGYKIKGNNKGLCFSQLVEEYLTDCVTNAIKTIEHKKATYEMFQSICGDLPVHKIARFEARKFKAMLLKSPANVTKIMKETSYLNIDWDNLPDGKPQSLVTVNNRLIGMLSLFTWAEQNDLYEGKNPFSGLSIKKADSHIQRRPPFSRDNISVLFSSPIYKGCLGIKPRERMLKGQDIFKDYKYWIPLIGLYTGMRLNEICQLETADIQCVDGVWFININDDGNKRLKTASSRRRVPVHKDLIRFGFLVYVENVKAVRLFKELPRCGKGSYSYRFSKEFAIILKNLKLKEYGVCFHSFRHSFIDGLRNAGVEKSIAMTLVGHYSASDIHSGYGFGYTLSFLQEQINKVSFEIDE